MPNPSTRHAAEFTWLEGLALCLAMIGVQLSSEVINTWGTYFYSPSAGVGRTIYVAVGIVGYIFIIGTVWDAVISPLVGALSDKTMTVSGRWRLLPIRGRRLPYIFWGSVCMPVTAVAFWYPPFQEQSVLNFLYGTALLCLHWTFFALVYIPLLALGPEIARTEEGRIKIGTWIAVGMIVGLALAAMLPGVLIELLDPARQDIAAQVDATVAVPAVEAVGHSDDVPRYSPAGYRRLALLLALVSLILFQLPVWLIRERYDSGSVPVSEPPFYEGFFDAFRNKPFVVYAISFFLFSAGFMAAQRVLPYWVELGLGGSEETVTYTMVPFIAVALLSYLVIPHAARYLHVKWMLFCALFIIASGMPLMYLIGASALDSGVKIKLGMALFAWCGIGQGIIYVMMTPIMGEIIDYDERRSGRRREALYNGLSGVAWKASMAISVFIATQSMSVWGNSAERHTGVLLVGPIAGVFAFLGLFTICFYPRLDKASGIHSGL